MMRIVIAGGTGQVGTILARYFHASGHQVTVLSRKATSVPWQSAFWDGRTLGPWTQHLEGADAVINLSGRSIQCRFTPANRRQLLDSRVVSTQLVGLAIRNCERPPALWLNASAANLYIPRPSRDQDEITGELAQVPDPSVPETWNFAVELTKRWEAAFFESPAPRTRKVALRTSLVLSPDRGGVFSVLLKLVRLGLGGAQGSGSQYVSWIHEIDYARAVDFLIGQPEISGPVIMAAPDPLPNRIFMRDLRRAARFPVGLPAYTWMLSIGSFLLRTEPELVLKSRRVTPAILLGRGFKFQYPTWPEACHDLLVRSSTVR